MRFVLSFILVILSTQLFAQNDSINYRFGFSISAFSTMNYGLKSFYNLETNAHWEQEYQKIYKDEKYTLDYQNFNFSKDIDLQLSVNWISNENYILRQSFSMFKGKATERATLTLTSYGEKTGIEDYSSIYQSDYQYWADNLAVGYQTSFKLESTYMGFSNNFILLKILNNNLNVGVGVSVIVRTRAEWPVEFESGYLEKYLWDHIDSYHTRQLCISSQIEKNIGRFTGFVNLSQSILTLKIHKGNRQLDDDELIARSNNLDYRFPLYIKAGFTINFKKINR